MKSAKEYRNCKFESLLPWTAADRAESVVFEMKQYLSVREAVLDLFGAEISSVQPVTGGDINRAYRLTINEINVFMKANSRENLPFFLAEAAGLETIAETKTICVPKILGAGTDQKYGSFLLLEWCQGISSKTFFETFGHQLAAMHLADTRNILESGKYGYYQDNYIGSSKQENTAHDAWGPFYRECRLAPQFRRASAFFDSADFKRIEYLMDHLDLYLPEPDRPSVLHGDLWCGNYITGNDGEAWLIDPAVYVGHAEADLAMTELFGGFPREFYSAYDEVCKIDREYARRRDLYNLYHVLNHLNLFGGSYIWEVKRILRLFGG